MHLRAGLLVAICAVFAAPNMVSAGTAGDVRVTFANGRVTVIATDATLAEILQEWARVGGSRFVNAEKIPSVERLTLRLENELEMHAIEVLLRSTAGYVVAPRLAAAGGSSLGNIVIQATTRAGSFAQAPRPAMPSSPSEEVAAPQLMAGPPRPDDDGPTRQQMPPPAPVPVPQPQQTQGYQNPMQPNNAPMGQASPLQGTQTQTVPGLGAVTSSQPGAIIPGAAQRPGGRPPLTPTQPRRPGGGG